jgi:hypothetical protein
MGLALLHGLVEGRATLFPASLRGDIKTANRVWAARVEHSIEDGHADSRLGLLAREASRSQARTDDGLVSAHRGFNQSALSVVGLFLPAQPSSSCNRKNVLASLRWLVLALGTEDRCHMWRDNHSDIFAVTGYHFVGMGEVVLHSHNSTELDQGNVPFMRQQRSTSACTA